MRILFQGDSITDGNRGRGTDPNHAIGHSYTYSVASHFGSKYPEKNYEFLSRGVSGDDIKMLSARWQDDTISLNPDILSILIGVNDAYYNRENLHNYDSNLFEEIYRRLLNGVLTNNPNTKIIILEPFTLNTGNYENYSDFENLVKINARISKKIADEFGATFIPLQEIFNSALKKAPVNYWIWDSVHPTYNGHGLIAQAFIEYTRNLI